MAQMAVRVVAVLWAEQAVWRRHRRKEKQAALVAQMQGLSIPVVVVGQALLVVQVQMQRMSVGTAATVYQVPSQEAQQLVAVAVVAVTTLLERPGLVEAAVAGTHLRHPWLARQTRVAVAAGGLRRGEGPQAHLVRQAVRAL